MLADGLGRLQLTSERYLAVSKRRNAPHRAMSEKQQAETAAELSVPRTRLRWSMLCMNRQQLLRQRVPPERLMHVTGSQAAR